MADLVNLLENILCYIVFIFLAIYCTFFGPCVWVG